MTVGPERILQAPTIMTAIGGIRRVILEPMLHGARGCTWSGLLLDMQ
jgi:hypothetical protein